MPYSPQHGLYSPAIRGKGAIRLSPMEGVTVDRLPCNKRVIADDRECLPFIATLSADHKMTAVDPMNNGQLDEVDEEAERRARRNRRIADLQQQDYNSPDPGLSGASVSRRRENQTGSSGLSNAQIADHYSSCIKLCTENKVSVKNAFNLHLIDYMREVMLTETDGELNFQMAGTSLDASAKIYAYRVDVVHQDVYRMVGGLGRAEKNDKQKSGGKGVDDSLDDENANIGDPGDQSLCHTPKKKRKKVWRGKTIETNIKNISTTTMDVAYEGDSLFHKVCSAFDGGGTSGLLLNSVRTCTDDGQLMLHSYWSRPKPNSLMGHSGVFENIQEFTDILHRVQSQDLQSVCPSIQNFQFCLEDEKSNRSVPTIPGLEEFHFNHDRSLLLDDCEDYPPGGIQFPDDNEVDVSDNTEVPEVFLPETHTDVEPHVRCVNNITNITRLLSVKPLEYSYFVSSAVQTWAGPEHWKVRNIPGNRNSYGDTGPGKAVGGKKKKEEILVDFCNGAQSNKSDRQDSSYDVGLNHGVNKIINDVSSSKAALLSPKVSRAATTLTRSTLEKWAQQESTLDPSLDYAPEKFYSLLLKPNIKARKNRGLSEQPLDSVGDYKYDSPADNSQFIPDHGSLDDDDDDDAEPLNNDSCHSTTNPELHDEAHGELEMVAAPSFKPPDLKSLKFSKVAKKVDVRKLKSLMWEVLTEKLSVPLNISNEGFPCEALGTGFEECSFRDLYRKILTEGQSVMADNLTPHIVFVCFLHMCNEKTLLLQGTEDHSDFRIVKG